MRQHLDTTHSVLDDQPNAMATPSTSTQITAPENCETKDRENCLIRENMQEEIMALQLKLKEVETVQQIKTAELEEKKTKIYRIV